MRSFDALPRAAVLRVLNALLGIQHVSVEDRAAVLVAVNALLPGWISRTRCTWPAAHVAQP